ncbi:MAG: histidine triad nucleotide-binding protein [Candidatus Yanofskybacteria bacterium CG10_big_fil_rev_8_21_14_0_10_46_23]|uniref:Histidine triad nucleotide-binding protein n=1 Tax=Candidatus Yanofskybacteria bacterium CG10_big_fil_rev_8_21_14_0_10_46_23 TaxID=1975098 RepID=A0A2H0R3N1_9BACT|nr:MAG: histidine triad nucleotide-binding protein [Candidatus Yanofskybacteria bacterium CG10_big_fil_rev_8_21_14_0_10_46_23]
MPSIFSKIVAREIPAEIIAEGEDWMAFKDIHPKAPVHVLIIPKKEIRGIQSAGETDKEILGNLMLAVGQVAQNLGLAESGYRVMINQGRDGGQEVDHLHLHLLGGKKL